MSIQSSEEKKHHDKIYDLSCGYCWANVTPAGQIRQDRRAGLARECIKISKGIKILEIGCGNGEFSRRFLNNGADMHCVDISPKLIKALKEKYAGTNLRFEIADIENLSYPDEYFDAIIGNGVLHHLDLEICLKEIRRVLKKNGKIFFCEPNMLNPEVFLETNIRWIGKKAQKTDNETAFVRWSLTKKLRDNNFKNIVVVPFDFLQPLTPNSLIKIVSKIGAALEKTPLMREIAGSLKIFAEK